MALIEGQGTSESVWQHWLGALAAPRCEPAGLAGRDERLVVLAPHPDDEVLACGGLLAMHRAAGGACLVVALTDGEASDPRLDAPEREALARRRRAEREAGLRCLGLDARMVVRCGLPDGDLARHAASAQSLLEDLLRPDDVLLTTWRYDGHPDHEAAGFCAARAAHTAGVRLIEAPVWMWHWARPADPRVPWHRLVALPLTDAVLDRKRAALDEHRSQLATRSGGEQAVLGRGSIERAARLHEHYIV